MDAQWTTMDNDRQQWTTMDNNGQKQTTMDNNGQQSAVLHASLMPFFISEYPSLPRLTESGVG